MRTTKTIVFTAAILIAWSIAIGVLARTDRSAQPERADRSDRPTAFSPPEEAQTQSLSVSNASPITTTGMLAADIVGAGAGPVIICENLGLLCSDPGTGASDDVRGLSYGYDFVSTSLPPIQFSVVAGSRGLTGTAVRAEADCTPAEPAADVFETALDGLNEQDLDGNGTACSTNSGFGLDLSEAVSGDNVDEIERDPCLSIDPDCNGVPDEPLFMTLAPGSPTLAEIGATARDILITSPDFAPQVWASGSSDLGLTSGDVIDALCVLDNGDAVYGAGDQVLFSLAAGSPTLTTWNAGPADVLRPQHGVMYAASKLGLLATDDVDGLTCSLEVQLSTLYLPLIRK
ncbi:MAG: hypothetical protein HY870_23625 [Chloroflexi bacterium]|nr:hypothetical protein [Chloroflexota bacterium]